jgi:phosphatidylinositol-3-phosphatase
LKAALAALLAAALLVLAACSDGAGSPPVVAAKRSPGSRVVVIVMENKERTQVLGSPQAPYLTRLARRYASPSQFYGIRHPSLPNYLALIGGSTFGVQSDCTSCNQSGRTLVDQLEGARISWRAYMEGMPKPCFTGAESGRYAKRHNPFAYFRGITGNPSRCAKVVPGSRLASDLRGGKLPRFVWLTPDLCNDMHDCSVKHGDSYLAKQVPPLLRQLGPRGFLVITFDEGESSAGGGGRIPTIVAGPGVRRGAQPSTRYNHYSTLRTIEDALGLPHLRSAGSVKSLSAVFTTPPRLR